MLNSLCKGFIVALFLVVFVGSAAASDSPQAKDIPPFCRIPILFVHGYFAGPTMTWEILLNRFRNDGCPEEYLYAPEFDDRTGCNPDHGLQVKRWVETLVERTGIPYVNIIAHSMGGLDTRYYIKYLCGWRRVKNVITLGGAHHGTVVACSEPISCGAESMCRGPGPDDWRNNEFLVEINSCDETPGNNVLYTSIWSEFDEIIRPPESSILDGAWNIELNTPLVGHWSVIQVPESYEYIKRALLGEGKNTTIEPEDNPCVVWCPPFEDQQEEETEPELEPEPEPELGTDGDSDSLLETDQEPSTEQIEQDPDLSIEQEPEPEQDPLEAEPEGLDEAEFSTESLDEAFTESDSSVQEKEFQEATDSGFETLEQPDEEPASELENGSQPHQQPRKSGSADEGCNSFGAGLWVVLLFWFTIKKANKPR